MNYTLNCPSLEHIALVKIATTLWNQDDIRALMPKINFQLIGYEEKVKWQEIENKVKEKVPHLSLPKSLKEEILGFIGPVGLRILKWMEYHNGNLVRFSLCIDLPSELCWTPQGTVDLKKTAEGLIKDESLDVASRYKLACTYCLEDDVLELWSKIPKNQRKSFYTGKGVRKVRQQGLVDLWTYNIKEEMNKLGDCYYKSRWQQERIGCSPYQYAFEYAAAIGDNKAATEYFLQKLTSKEREESLVRTAREVVRRDFKVHEECNQADVLCFLLSQMDGEQQTQVFESDPSNVLKCLLNWPWQSLFMETANQMWDFLYKENYEGLLFHIVYKVIYKDYDYEKLFREFWQQSPNALKRYVIDRCARGFLLSSLLMIKCKDNFKLILKDATLIEKRKIIFSDMGQSICHEVICEDEWDLLQFFIRECISSKEEMVKFKEEFEGRLKRLWEKVEFAKRKDKFFQLLDEFINGYNKRKSVAEVDSSPAKRLHSTEFEEVTHSMKK